MSESNVQKMQSPYTPTTEEVRGWYRPTSLTCGAEFDRWLAEVKAQAWEEGWKQGWDDSFDPGGAVVNPYSKGENK